MATTIRVDPDDELPAILDRLPARDVCILVLPPHARALNSVVGAKLLARRAQTLETQVAVVSEDRAVAAHVRAAGIPVAESVAEAARLLPAKLLFDDAAPLAPPVDEAAPANGARPAAPHEELTLPHPVVEPPTANSSTDDSRPNDSAGSGAGDAPPKAQTYRFVAWQPNASTQAAADTPTPAGAEEETEQPPVRGHSGGARAARKGNRSAGSGASSPAGAGGASSTGAVYTAGAARRATEPRVPPATTTGSAAGHAMGARPGAARPPRLWEMLGSEGLTRVLVPALLGIVLLLLLLWLIVSVLGAIFNPTANLTVQARAIPIAAPDTVTVHTYTTLPPRKRIGPYTKLFFANKPEKDSVTLPANGTRTLPGAVAGGQLVLRNLLNRPIIVPSGTAFTTSLNGHTFVTTRDVTVPAAQITFNGADYGKATAAIKAAVGGTAGNVPARTIGNVPAGFSGSLSVTNTVPTSGGSDLSEKVPLQSDVDAAASKLFARLEARARQDIAALGVPGGGDMEQHTLFVARSPVAPRVNGAPATARTATLTLSVVLHAAYVRKADLQQAARTAIGPQPHLLSGSVAYTARWQPDNSIVVAASARTVPPIDPDAIKAAINGQTAENAKAYLDRQTTINIARYHIDLAPIWASHVPSDFTRIHITVQPPQ